MLRKTQFIFTLLCSGLLLASCSSDDDSIDDPINEPGASEQYVMMATDSENSYLLTSEEITEGSVSAQTDNSTQVIGTPRWYFAKDMAAYGFIYRQGDPGTTQSFALNENGQLEARNEINLTVSIQSKGLVDDEIYMQYSSRNYEEPFSTFYTIDPVSQAVNGPIEIRTDNIADNDEYAYITDVAGYNGKVLLGFRTIKAGSDGGEETQDLFDSDFNDHTYVAVYNKEMEFEQLIVDSGRTGVVAGQYRGSAETGIEPVENGDIYVFSSALDAEDVPSGILKINNGTWEFDADYFFNISEASGGYKLYRTYYVGDDTFVLQMFTEPNTASAGANMTHNKFAVVNVKNETFSWVNDVPEGILNIGEPYVNKEDKEVVFPIETSAYPALFSIDANNAQMTKGLEIKAEEVTAVGKLTIQ